MLDSKRRINGNNLIYHYKLPPFYREILENVVFPSVHSLDLKAWNLNLPSVTASFLVTASDLRGHGLRQHLSVMSQVLGINYVYKDCVELLGANMSSTVVFVDNFLCSALKYKPLILHLDCLHLFRFEAQIHSHSHSEVLPMVEVLQRLVSRHDLVLFGSAPSHSTKHMTKELRALFTFEYDIECSLDGETELVPTSLLPHISGLKLVNGLSTRQLFEVAHSADYQECIDSIRRRQSLFGALNVNVSSIPSVQWADVGGLEAAKRQILDIMKGLPMGGGIKQSMGILLYGPPGTGKTLLAKAMATEFSMNFISIKGPELLDPFVGQSEENIRSVFEKAKESRPCILFFDEIDALVPSRGRASDGGNVMDRVVSQLLTEIDGVSHALNGEVFMMAATNRPDLLDAALLRPKRLDKQIYLGVPAEKEDKLKILKALTRKFEFEGDAKMSILREVAANDRIACFSGADLYALCCDAMMCSTKRLIEEMEEMADGVSVDLFMEMVKNKERRRLEELYAIKMSDKKWDRIKSFKVKLKLEHFESALKNIKPSLTQREILQYQSMHRKQRK